MSEFKPSSTGKKITRIYAWVAIEADGGEGICAASFGGVVWPLVGADRERIESLRQHAASICVASGCPVLLKVFDGGTVIDTLDPKP